MRFDQLVQLYFERSNALQWYWTLYVVVIGGLLAFSSLRQQPDRLKAVLVTVLFCCFAYKNLGAINDTASQRYAILQGIKGSAPPMNSDFRPEEIQSWQALEPTLDANPGSAGTFHIACDVLTVVAVWGMEWRRRKTAGRGGDAN